MDTFGLWLTSTVVGTAAIQAAGELDSRPENRTKTVVGLALVGMGATCLIVHEPLAGLKVTGVWLATFGLEMLARGSESKYLSDGPRNSRRFLFGQCATWLTLHLLSAWTKFSF